MEKGIQEAFRARTYKVEIATIGIDIMLTRH